MEITTDLKNNILNETKSIETIEVVYKKKKKYAGTLASVKQSPFEIKIVHEDKKEDAEHLIDFELAQEITIKFHDDTVKVYKDSVI